MDLSETTPTGFSTMTSAIGMADNYNGWILDVFRPYLGKRLLEIGTGQGNFKRYLSGLDLYVSCDIDPEVIERARKHDPDTVYEVADISGDSFVGQFSQQAFDAVLCTNVIEHIEDDRKAAANLVNVLVPGGHLLLFTPAFPVLYNDMDRLAGHHRRYTKETMRRLFRDLPSELVLLRYFNSVGGVGWWVNKSVSHRDLDSAVLNRQVTFFDRWVVPLARAVDPFTRGFFGQSIICVLRRTVSK